MYNTFEVKTTSKNNKKYFTIDITEFHSNENIYLVIYEFTQLLYQDFQYIWNPQRTSDILKNITSKDNFIEYFEFLKQSDIMSESMIMDGTRLSPTGSDIFDSDSDSQEKINTRFINVTKYIGNKKNIAYVGSVNKYYQFDIYKFDMIDSDKGLVFNKRELLKGIIRDIQTIKKSESNIPYFINGEQFSNNKMKYLLTSRLEKLKELKKVPVI